MTQQAWVYLEGAGPGDPDLLTVESLQVVAGALPAEPDTPLQNTAQAERRYG